MKEEEDTWLEAHHEIRKIYTQSYKRKKFECISSEKRLYAMNTSKNTYIALLFTFAGSFHLLSGFAEAYSTKEDISLSFVASFAVLFVFGLMSLRQFLWLIRGTQELIIENGQMVLHKKGTFFTKPKVYMLDKIKNIRQKQDKTTLREKFSENSNLIDKTIFSHNTREILFDYNNKSVKFFCDMTIAERTLLIDEILKYK